jgi:hypothetical protein
MILIGSYLIVFLISRLYNSVCFYAVIPIRIQPILMSFETLNRLEAIDIGMADENNNSQREAKAAEVEECKEEVIKAQTPGPKTAEVFRQEASNKKAKDTDT